ncbi:MAG TPA: hypothetical protein VF297_30185 [Pyrinomonadaceae bacterium]
MRQSLFRLCIGLVRFVCREALRAVITCLILMTCLYGALSYFGLPMPDVFELLEKVESVSELSRILS